MKRLAFLLIIVLFCAWEIKAQSVLYDDFSQLKLGFSMPDVSFSDDNGQVLFNLDGYMQGGEEGKPSLPVQGHLLTIPFCKDIEVVVTNATYDTIAISDISPLQPVRFKSDTSKRAVVMDSDFYQRDEYYSLPLVSVQMIGVARDKNLASLCFAPVQINAFRHTAVVCRKADVTLKYVEPDIDSTMRIYLLHHTPAFSVVKTLNNPFDNLKDPSLFAPIRMLIATRSNFHCYALDDFVQWKREQGMIVDVVYLDEQGLTTPSALSTYLRSQYTNATTSKPAPVYIVLLGDVSYVPTITSDIVESEMDLHPTDTRFAYWTGNDYIPDAFIGRISVATITDVMKILTKTIYYERYDFEDDSYLTSAALLAGEDEGEVDDYAYAFVDPSMDYVAKYYINASNGFNNVYYYKNNTSFAPQGVRVTGSSLTSNAGQIVREHYNNGLGWINYSGHGFYNMWYSPYLSTAHASVMSNVNKPSIMIGNCCLSNKFDENTCLGEALLRRGDNAGAVAFIGATNSTTWSMDFYWMVGLRSSIYNTMNATYNSSRMGMYDRLFHTHNESYSNHAITTAGMVYAGNMAVQSMVGYNTYKRYYWEIYEVMGDPSLMPWLGKAKEPYLAIIDKDSSAITIRTMPNAYVALLGKDSLPLLSATFATNSGYATLKISDDIPLSECIISAMAQNYKQYFQPMESVSTADNPIVKAQVYPNPASQTCSISALGLTNVKVFSLDGRLVKEENCKADNLSLSVADMPKGLYIIRATTHFGVSSVQLLVQ